MLIRWHAAIGKRLACESPAWSHFFARATRATGKRGRVEDADAHQSPVELRLAALDGEVQTAGIGKLVPRRADNGTRQLAEVEGVTSCESSGI